MSSVERPDASAVCDPCVTTLEDNVQPPQQTSPRNGGLRPVPDPTELTDRAIARAEKAITQYIDSQLAIRDERLRGIDEATKLRLEYAEHMPEAVTQAVTARALVVDEKFHSVDQRFVERDTRAERESRDNKVAVDAAFAAQKEAAAKQDEGNQKAIDKSERSTAEKIDKLAELFSTTVEALSDKIDDLKERTSRIESTKVGATESRTGMYAAIGVLATVLFVAIAIAGVLASRVTT